GLQLLQDQCRDLRLAEPLHLHPPPGQLHPRLARGGHGTVLPQHDLRDRDVDHHLGDGQRAPGIRAGPVHLPRQEDHLRAARARGLPSAGLHGDPDLRSHRHPGALGKPVGDGPRGGRRRERDRRAAVGGVLRAAAKGARGSREGRRRRLPADLRTGLSAAVRARPRDGRDPPVHARVERLPAASRPDLVPARAAHAGRRDLQLPEPVLQRLGDDVRGVHDRPAPDHHRVHRPAEILHRLLLRSSERVTHSVNDSNSARPNIILVCVDQMRADAMGVAGNDAIDTPNLDDLARGGYHFPRAYSATPTCVPARVALLTGKSQAAHGRYGDRGGISFPDAYPVTLPSALREHGHHTYAVGEMHVFPDRARGGFDGAQLHDGLLHTARRLAGGPADDYTEFLRAETGDPRADYQDTGIGCNAMTARPWEREERLHPTRWVADQSLRFLERRDPSRPFFLYMSFHRPHAPFDPPGWLWEKYRERDLGARPVGDWVSRFDEHRRDHGSEAEFGAQKESVHQQVRAGYYGSIEFIDMQLNRLRETLSDQGLLEDTVIVFVSDHGDMMGDHDMYRKSVG